MKAISLWQPLASAMALGLKSNETRGRATHVRGPVAIHAAMNRTAIRNIAIEMPHQNELLREAWHRHEVCSRWPTMLPTGYIVATGMLVACEAITLEIVLATGHTEYLFGDYTEGRFIWKFESITPLAKPVPCKGRQGWFEWEEP